MVAPKMLAGAARCLRAVCILAFSATFILGCAAPAVSLREGPREYVATDYGRVLKKWTREESLVLFDELERALAVTSTFHSWDFRWAYVIRYARDYRLTVPQRELLLLQHLNESHKQHEFFVALYGTNRRYDDISSERSAWTIRLIDSTGNEIAPVEIEKIKRPTLLERRYYPYNTVWRQSFRIRFPVKAADGRPTISAAAGWFGLRFAGAYGSADLLWELTADKAKAGPGE